MTAILRESRERSINWRIAFEITHKYIQSYIIPILTCLAGNSRLVYKCSFTSGWGGVAMETAVGVVCLGVACLALEEEVTLG